MEINLHADDRLFREAIRRAAAEFRRFHKRIREMSQTTCTDCRGSGEYVGLVQREPCRTCGGKGRVPTAVDDRELQTVSLADLESLYEGGHVTVRTAAGSFSLGDLNRETIRRANALVESLTDPKTRRYLDESAQAIVRWMLGARESQVLIRDVPDYVRPEQKHRPTGLFCEEYDDGSRFECFRLFLARDEWLWTWCRPGDKPEELVRLVQWHQKPLISEIVVRNALAKIFGV